MPRRVSLPGAAELFRPTQPAGDEVHEVGPEPPAELQPVVEDSNGARGSGRVRHDEKITVYVSSDELVALEQARLTMRARHGLAVDRGRIVREAISAAIVDLETNGPDSELVERLYGRTEGNPIASAARRRVWFQLLRAR